MTPSVSQNMATAPPWQNPPDREPEPEQNRGDTYLIINYKRYDPEGPGAGTAQEKQGNDLALSSLWLLPTAVGKVIDDAVVALPRRSRPPRQIRTFNPSAEWEGYVEDIGEEEFTVRLVNINSDSSVPEEMATFKKSDISDKDRSLLVPGAIVRWSVGLEQLPDGQRRRVSLLYFRDLPAHSTRDLERARAKAKSLLNSISWE